MRKVFVSKVHYPFKHWRPQNLAGIVNGLPQLMACRLCLFLSERFIAALKSLGLEGGQLGVLGWIHDVAARPTPLCKSLLCERFDNVVGVDQLNDGRDVFPVDLCPVPQSALSARAAFITGSGQLGVTISNLLTSAEIVSAGQAVSDLSFTLSNAPGTLGFTSANGTFATFSGTAFPTFAAGNPTRWLGVGGGDFSISGNTIKMEAIGGGQPSQMILPSGSSYPAANASITNGMFSPYVDGPAQFILFLPGVTSETTITSATFSFGTGPDTFITVPSPIVGAGLPGLIAACGDLLALARRRRKLVV